MIGISNVNPGQLELLCERATIKPMVVQNRCFSVLEWDQEVREICQANKIIYQGFSLLTANRGVLGDPEVQQIAPAPGRYSRSSHLSIRFGSGDASADGYEQ